MANNRADRELCRLPELDAIAFRVSEPAEAAVVVLFALAVHGNACGRQLVKKRVKIIDFEVDHDRLRGGEVIRLAREKRERSGSTLIIRLQYEGTMRKGEAEMVGVPSLRDLGFSARKNAPPRAVTLGMGFSL